MNLLPDKGKKEIGELKSLDFLYQVYFAGGRVSETALQDSRFIKAYKKYLRKIIKEKRS